MILFPLAILLALAPPSNLPVGSAPQPVSSPWFPDTYHAFVWRNWSLVPTDRMAKVVGATRKQIVDTGSAMGLPKPPPIPDDQWRRSALTIIRRNWHLLPYDQLLTLLDWDEAKLAYTLREDDFLFVKLGSLKPNCPPIRYHPPDAATRRREAEIAGVVRDVFPNGIPAPTDRLFGFVKRLSTSMKGRTIARASRFSPRFCYSYFALYGDPLLDTHVDPYPDGYLARMAQSGVDGVWLQGVLSKLTPFPWDPQVSEGWETRLKNLRGLVARAKRHGIGIYLYLNEPRAMPLSFFTVHRELQGVVEGDHAALCVSEPSVRAYLVDSVARICREVPDLAGFFTITASENLSNCWSHYQGASCPRCAARGEAAVIADVNAALHDGVVNARGKQQLICWDWGWRDAVTPGIIEQLPAGVALQSVSEWDLPIKRGGIDSVIGEYSLSAVGPGPRAVRNWKLARDRGLATVAKIQAANSWELAAVPYVPAVANAAQHAANLRDAGVNGLMLGWTLGGYPSPNLEVVAEIGAKESSLSPDAAMLRVATRRYGSTAAPAVVEAWKECSDAYTQFPFHIGLVYTAPLQLGPANPLWLEPTGYKATMVGFPYDDVDGWRQVYPVETFAGQLEQVAEGFATAGHRLHARAKENEPLGRETGLMEACAIHFRSVARQARFNHDRGRASNSALRALLEAEIADAKRLFDLQSGDSRIGFEASNEYFYVPLDLIEKVVDCRYVLDLLPPR